MERGQIERSNFAQTRRGYDPAAVDAHLREVAAAVEELQDQVEELSARPETLSRTANERLRRILEAAEASAQEISAEAEQEARALTVDARREAQTIIGEAERRARERDSESETSTSERLSRVDTRTGELMQRADELDEQFDRLLERMRAAGEAAVATLRDEAQGLRNELDELPGESVPAHRRSLRDEDELEPPARIEPEHPTAVVEPDPADEPLGDELRADRPDPRATHDQPIEDDDAPFGRPEDDRFDSEPEDEPLGDEVIPEPRGDERLPEPPEEPLADPDYDPDSAEPLPEEDEPTERRPSGGAGDSDQDMEGARLIALNMALSGSSRAETAEYLRETFGFEDQALLDDVYDRVQAP